MTTLSPGDIDARVVSRLENESVIWLTTVGANGVPATTPVWFLFHDGAFVLQSQPQTGKLRHIEHDPSVALNLNCTPEGGDVVVFTGSARHDPQGQSRDEWDAYVDKYRGGMSGLGFAPDTFADSYSETVRITPTKLRSW
ncbi:TIGR03667 family PPOX class F420-dependent oxidoreductase [Rhodococcus sp. HNM0569]|uniref:TIGR03667 family PPOX class F420-dependent oxidoreductase n=1 Tax=Rhodococcus sp. HNM0569 TaxID=2716340 RepID=UPI00146F3A9E|nr:TIGR03667 family PPOX class F420-dependent oxidoreductase [Rhodococcus sp. HNM0569]